jgi:hypothetical protein
MMFSLLKDAFLSSDQSSSDSSGTLICLYVVIVSAGRIQIYTLWMHTQ